MWEYKVALFRGDVHSSANETCKAFEDFLNVLGNDEWEVISVVEESGANSMMAAVICKRER